MIAKDLDIGKMGEVVQWWLSYNNSLGRCYILNEGALKYPISEYLERSNVEEIILEYGHPKLSGKRIDLFCRNKSKQKNAFEFKYIKDGSTRSTNGKEKVFNDLMRLFLFLDKNHRAYFLICGQRVDFIRDFQKIKEEDQYITPKSKSNSLASIVPEGFYTKWFSFDRNDPSKEIEIQNQKKEYKDIYNKFKDKYYKCYKKQTGANLVLPTKLKTCLIYLSSNSSEPQESLPTSKIGIWEISK